MKRAWPLALAALVAVVGCSSDSGQEASGISPAATTEDPVAEPSGEGGDYCAELREHDDIYHRIGEYGEMDGPEWGQAYAESRERLAASADDPEIRAFVEAAVQVAEGSADPGLIELAVDQQDVWIDHAMSGCGVDLSDLTLDRID